MYCRNLCFDYGLFKIHRLPIPVISVGNIALGGTLTSNRTITSAGFDLFFDGAGSIAIGTNASANKLDVEGGAAIGATYSGVTAAPANGLIVEGNVGIGTSAPSNNRVLISIPSTDATNPIGLKIDNNYTGVSTKFGIDVNVDGAGSGPKYGISSSVIGLAGDASANYGYQVAMTPNGTGSAFGVYSNITSAGTGIRYGFRNSVNGAAGNTSDIYGTYTSMTNSGTGSSYGSYTTGEDYNYFSGSLGIGINVPTAKFDVQNSSLSKVFNAVLTASGGLGQVFNFERTQAPIAGNDMFQLVVPTGSPTGFQFLEAQVGSNVVFRVDGNGSAYSDGTFNPGGADYAELVEVSKNSMMLEPGDVIVIDTDNGKMTKASTPRSTLVAGIYSTKPGIIGSEKSWASGTGSDEEGGQYNSVEERIADGEVPLAMLGIVPCKVSAENGSIKPGDLLVTSSTPGYAMKDENPKPGTIVGKALQALESGSGVIKIMVTLQ